MSKEKKEMVHHPDHYNQGKIEVIDAIYDWDLNFSLGSAVKYIARSPHKGKPIEDLEKAAQYIDFEIRNLKGLPLKDEHKEFVEKICNLAGITCHDTADKMVFNKQHILCSEDGESTCTIEQNPNLSALMHWIIQNKYDPQTLPPDILTGLYHHVEDIYYDLAIFRQTKGFIMEAHWGGPNDACDILLRLNTLIPSANLKDIMVRYSDDDLRRVIAYVKNVQCSKADIRSSDKCELELYLREHDRMIELGEVPDNVLTAILEELERIYK